ncbi:MAG: FAD-dependent oxidoreductase [Bacteroidota bacterium]
MRPPIRIVLLGGGYATVFAYRRLRRRLRQQIARGSVQVTVVSPLLSHAFHGWTGEVLAGLIPEAHSETPLRDLFPGARILCARAVSVCRSSRRVRVQTGRDGRGETYDLPYDHLLVGFGARDASEGVPGLQQFGHGVRGAGGISAFRDHVLDSLERAESASTPPSQGALTFVVAGGGFTGVEHAAALAELLRAARSRYGVLRHTVPRVVLAHSGNALLPDLRPRFDRLANYATRQLTNAGVEVLLNTRLESVEADHVTLSDDTQIDCAGVLSTIGTGRVPLPGLPDTSVAPCGRIRTIDTLRVEGDDTIWAAGDAARVPFRGGPVACPANALWAIRQGEHVGENIARSIRGRTARPFRYRGLGQAASLGVGRGVMELYGVQVTGWPAWIGRLGFFLWFMPSRSQAARVVLDWMLAPFTARDLAPSGWATGHGQPDAHPSPVSAVSGSPKRRSTPVDGGTWHVVRETGVQMQTLGG